MTQTRLSPAPARSRDPRLYQIAVLSCLLVYGVGRLHFDVAVGRIWLTLATCLATQYLCTRLWALPRFDPRSPVISGLSLCLLLRTDLAALVVATAIVTVASKFLLRVGGRHLFNPTNVGLVVMMLATGQVSGCRPGSGAAWRSSRSCLPAWEAWWSIAPRAAT